jgi:uncharacterized coiled-coil protein SlyX
VATGTVASVREWPAGRWFVWIGLAVGVFFGVQLAATGSSLYEAFLKGVAATAAVMVLAGLAQRLYEGDKVHSAQLPGGAGAEFETAAAATKTRQGIEQLNDRVTKQSEQMVTMQAQLDRRVSDLEAETFKEGRDGRDE